MGSPASDDMEVFFLPWIMAGHLRPMMGMAKVFASRGAKASVLAAADEAAALQPLLDWSAFSGHRVRLLLLPSSTSEIQEPLRRLLRDDPPPSCVIFDAYFPWVPETAAEFSVPAFAFTGSSCFASCTNCMLARHPPPPFGESFVVPGLPHRVELLRTQLLDSTVPDVAVIVSNFAQSKARSAGLVINSFDELEADYLEKIREILGKEVWPVGPLLPVAETAAGESASCLKWLDGKKSGSVVYICFGSMAQLAAEQLQEIGAALERIGCPFVWVVRGQSEEEIFVEKNGGQNQGLVITGWAPQILILGHGAVGAFVTHCGWNSCIEAIAAGVPMVTWPLMAEQFINEKLVTQVLCVGVEVGSKVWAMKAEERDLIGREDIGRAIEKVIGEGEERAALRKRAAELSASARKAVAEGGSSYESVGSLMDLLRQKHPRPQPPPVP